MFNVRKHPSLICQDDDELIVSPQRLKGFNLDTFLDNKIAEEQNKQTQTKSSPAARRTPSNAPGNPRRSSARTDSPSKRTNSRRRAQDVEQSTPSKGPDPEDFVIGDDASDISRVATPMPVKEGSDGPILEEKGGEKAEDVKTEAQDESPPADKGKARESTTDEQELPEEVRKKLAKLESLTNRYQDLLRNYRTAHARVAAIEPFEATLREHTPLTSITEPGALVEFLDQRSLQSEMVMQELKRLSAENRDVVKERDELKVKLDDAEKKAKDAFDEAAGLREQQQEPMPTAQTAGKAEDDAKGTADDEFFSYDSEATRLEEEAQRHREELEAQRQQAETEAQQYRDELAKQRQEAEDASKKHQAEFVSQRQEVEAAVEKQQTDYINELSTELATVRGDYATIKTELEDRSRDLNAMENKVGIKERDIAGLKSELASIKAESESATTARNADREDGQVTSASLAESEARIVELQSKLDQKNQELMTEAAAAKESLRKYQAEHELNLKNGTYVEREEKVKAIQQNVVKQLQEDVRLANLNVKIAEGKNTDLQFELDRVTSEADNSGNVIRQLRGYEDAVAVWRKKAEAAEHARDAANQLAESKKGHEAAAASLRAQLKNATKERDQAYNMIINCNYCDPANKTRVQQSQTLQEPVNSSTPSRSRETSDGLEPGPSTLEAPTDGADVVAETATKKKSKKKRKHKPRDSASAEAAAEQGDASAAQGTSEVAPTPEESDRHETMSNELINSQKMAIEQHIKTIADRDQTLKEQGEAIDRHIRDLAEYESKNSEMDDEISKHIKTIAEHERTIVERDEEIKALHHKIGEQEAAIERLDKKQKDQEGLEEEIETLRESLLEAGSESTDAKHELKELQDRCKRSEEERDELQVALDTRVKEFERLEAVSEMYQDEIVELREAEDSALQVSKEACEKQIEELKAQHLANREELDLRHNELVEKFEILQNTKQIIELDRETSNMKIRKLETAHGEAKTRSAVLETDLAAATELAQTRFKDITELKEHLNNKLQPELKKLRQESEELKTIKADLEKSREAVKRLEGRERDLRSEIAEYKTQGEQKDAEVASLTAKAKASDERSAALEDTYERSRKDLEANERTRDTAVEARDRVQAELKKAHDELKTTKASLDQLEVQVNKFRDEARTAHEELQMKSAQHESAQSLMQSYQDSARELGMQVKELREHTTSLEDEGAETQRLLSERSADNEKMRRLLSDAENRAEARVRAVQEQLDIAREERDRAEDDASTAGRRKAREIEELKGRLREAESGAFKATEARAGFENRERDYRVRQEELQKSAAQAQEEATETRAAMTQLQDALNDRERQTGDLETEISDLRKTISDRDAKLERLQKSGKSMAEELNNYKTKSRQPSYAVSSRTSIDSSSTRVMSPVPGRASNGTPVGGNRGGQEVDYMYLNTVLLQFLGTKEKKLQHQLVPVLKQLLHFNAQEEQKWNAAIAAR